MTDMIDRDTLLTFITESNRIEKIVPPRPRKREIEAHETLLREGPVGAAALEQFVVAVQPGARVRAREGLDVRVGAYVAPPGGRKLYDDLCQLLFSIADMRLTPYEAHVRYELLHPFTDGNGRSGRALWLWMMLRWEGGLRTVQRYGFLHAFYYQALDHAGREPYPWEV